MKPVVQTLAASAAAAVLLLATAANAQTVYTGDIIQGNSFGEVVREYHTEVAGQVSTLQRDAMIEPGTRVMQILHYNPDPACEPEGCPTDPDDYTD